MKKKITAICLSAIMLFSLTAMPVSAVGTEEIKTVITDVFAKALGYFVEAALNFMVAPIKEGDNFVSEDEYSVDNFCDGLYDGTDEFIDEAPDGAKWSLGSAEASLVPEDWESYDDLYIGGYMSGENYLSNDVREILDDMKVRVIAMSDGTDRGTAVFATVDSIGVGSPDVVEIREMLGSFARENSINSINVFTTHTHSGIDTQGLWTDIAGTWPISFVKGYSGVAGEYAGGTSEEYMAFFYERVSLTIEEAVRDMEEGTMTYAEKDFGGKYFHNSNRTNASSLDTKIRRFTFTPDNASSRPTVIVNMAAHPSTAGLPTSSDPVKGHGVSGDYVYYMGEVIGGAGYDFMFFNGAICGIYINRISVNSDSRVEIAADYGREIGKVVLSLTKTQEEILADSYLMSLCFSEEKTEGGNYVPWYEGWTAAEQTEVEPVLNIRLKAVETEITNPVIKLAAKLQVVNYVAKKTSDGRYIMTTEVGYMEMGDDIKIAFVPGELCTDLAFGGDSLTAEGSASGKAFTEKPVSEIFGEDVIVFGMANDAIGYIVPDNDYLMCLDFGHYHETISLGKSTASTLMKALSELKEEVR